MAVDRPLKIGLILDDSLDKTDGVQQYVLELGQWLSHQGHVVHYLVGETTRQDVAGVKSLSRNVHVRFNQNRMSMPLPVSYKKIRSLINAERYDILHVQMPYSPWLAHRLILAANNRTAVVGTFHIVAYSPVVRYASRLLARYTSASLLKFSTVMSVSQAAADYALETYKTPSIIVPNVVSIERFKSAKPLPAYDDSVLTILFLGRLVARKGCLYLLEALHLMQAHAALPKYRVLICGTGPLEASLKEYCSTHNLDGLVEFVGYVDEQIKPQYYASADISVFPSTGGESFGIVLAEALAAGRAAVIGGDNSGYRTLLGSRPELLFEPRDSLALAETLMKLLSDNRYRQEVATWGGRHAQQYDTQRVGPQIVEVYKNALRNRRHL